MQHGTTGDKITEELKAEIFSAHQGEHSKVTPEKRNFEACL